MNTLSPQVNFVEEKILLPSPSPGTERCLTVFRYGVRGAKPKIYIQTALHADEIPGMLVLHHLRKMLAEYTKEGRIIGEIVVVPVANPIGMSQRIQSNLIGRLDLNNGKNFNRHYPDLLPRIIEILDGQLGKDSEQNSTTITNAIIAAVDELPEQSESDAFRKHLLALSADADICLDLHCDFEAILYMYSSGTHHEIAEDLCATLGCMTHLVDSSNSQCFDGTVSLIWPRLARLYPDFPIPNGCMGSTIELRGITDVNDKTACQDARNILQFLINQQVIQGVPRSSKPKCQAYPLEGQIYLTSPISGVLSYKQDLGASIRKGDLIAEIVDPIAYGDEARYAVTSSISGIFFSRTAQRLVGPGQIIAGIAGKTPVPRRHGENMLSD